MNIFKTGVVQRVRKESCERSDASVTPRIHAVVFNPADGILHRMPIDFKARTRIYNGLYDLY